MSILNVSPEAEEDIEQIIHRIADDKPSAARRWSEQIRDRLQTLAEWPGLGPLRPELREGLRSLPFGNYVIFYCQIDNGVEVLRVVDGHRDVMTLF